MWASLRRTVRICRAASRRQQPQARLRVKTAPVISGDVALRSAVSVLAVGHNA